MNSRIKRLRAEIEKIDGKIAALQESKKEKEEELRKLENMEIVGLVRAEGLSLETFAGMMQQIRRNPIPTTGPTQPEQEV